MGTQPSPLQPMGAIAPTGEARCALCNYDLRAEPAGVCPECGATLVERQQAILQRTTKGARAVHAVVMVTGCLASLPVFALGVLLVVAGIVILLQAIF